MNQAERAERWAADEDLLRAVLRGDSKKFQLHRKTCSACGSTLEPRPLERLGLFALGCPKCHRDYFMVRVGKRHSRSRILHPDGRSSRW